MFSNNRKYTSPDVSVRSSVLSSRIITIIMMVVGMLSWGSSVWAAYEEDIYSVKAKVKYSVPASTKGKEITSDNAEISGGKMYVTNKQSSAKDLINDNCFKMTNGDTFFKLTFSSALEVGDRISVSIMQNAEASRGIWLHDYVADDKYADPKNGGGVAITTQTNGSAFEECSYTIVAGDALVGKSEICVYRYTGNTTDFQDFKVSRVPSLDTKAPTIEKGLFSLLQNKWAYNVLCNTGGALIHYQINDGTEETCESGTILYLAPNDVIKLWATHAEKNQSEIVSFTSDVAPAPTLTANKASAEVRLYPLALSKTVEIELTGTMLTGATKNAIRLENAVEGMSLDKTALTINDGNVSEKITLKYERSQNKTQAQSNVTLIIETDQTEVRIPVTYSAQTTTYSQTMVSDNRTWNFSDISKGNITLNDGNVSVPILNQDTQICYANLWPFYNENANFHATDLLVNSKYPLYNKTLQAKKVVFHSTVPGNFKITSFSSSDNNPVSVTVTAGNNEPVNVGSSANSSTHNTEAKWVDVPANSDVTITGSAEVRIAEMVFVKKSENSISLKTGGQIIQGGGEYSLTLTKGDEYTLTRGTDYTTVNPAAHGMAFTSSREGVATVDASGRIVTVSSGSTVITIKQLADDNYSYAEISLPLRVKVNTATSTLKPTVTVSNEGVVTITNNSLNPDADIYYAIGGDEPTIESTLYTAPFTPADGSIIKIIAKTEGKDESEIVTAYKNYAATFTWPWHGDYNIIPTMSDEVKKIVDAGTKATWGSQLNPTAAYNGVGGDGNWPNFAPLTKLSRPDVKGAFDFNIIPLTGYSFKPTSAKFDFSRVGTDGGNIDVAFVSGTKEYTLIEGSKPVRSSTEPKYSHYSTIYEDANPKTETNQSYLEMSDIPMSDDEWSLRIYQYNLDTNKTNLIGNISISGLFSGSEYDGEFYGVSVSATPEEGGTVTHSPSAAKIMAGKPVTFVATPKVGYKFAGWTNEGESTILSTDKTYVISSLNDITNMEAHFEALPLLSFEMNSGISEVKGILPPAVYADAETGEVYLPKNLTLYRENWTMTGWTDGTNTYAPGTYIPLKANKTVKPVFEPNTVKIHDTDEKVTIRWNLYTENGNEHEVPEINLAYNGTQTGYYTKRTTVNGKDIDVSLLLQAVDGSSKIVNNDAGVIGLGGGSRPGIQINNEATITIPAVRGMKVTVRASQKVDNRSSYQKYTKFEKDKEVLISFGGDHPIANGQYNVAYTYNGDDTNLKITFMNQGEGTYGFYEYIEVEYPVLPDLNFANSITGKLDMEKVENAGTVTKSVTTHPNTGSRYAQGDVVDITATAAYGYTITGFSCENQSNVLSNVTIAQDGKSATADYTIGSKTATVTAIYQRMPTYKVRVQTSNTALGTVSLEPSYENFLVEGPDYIEGYYVAGTNVTLVSHSADGNVLNYWMDDAGTWREEGNPNHTSPNEQITVTADNNFIAYFKLGEKGNVVFDLSGSGVVAESSSDYSGSVSIAPASLTDVRSFTIPTNFTFYKEGYTLTGWKTDGEASYALGQNYSFATADETITLKPVFQQNPADETNRLNNPIIRYDFGTGIFDYADPTSGETRKVAGQSVSIGKNTKTFWTSRVWANVLTAQGENPHWRDVALWVNTGRNGFIRNGDLPEWAAFGPGTTLEVPSCSGTKFSIMTYSPITTTTIDGVVPTLDEARSNTALHEYVYTYTTRNTDDRIKIVIGDDYSYYKWMEAATLAANLVDLHVSSQDEVRGTILKTESGTEFKEIELEDGGYSFQKGNKVVLTFQRKFGFELDAIIDTDNKTEDGEAFAVLKMNDDGTVTMVRKGNGMNTETVPSNGDNTWGNLTDHVFKLTKTETAGERTKYQLEFEITTHRNMQIAFKEKATYYVMYNAGKQATGTAPAAQWVEAGDKYTIPYNHTLYLEGYTLKRWEDDSHNTFNIGQEYTFTTVDPHDILLYPVFEKNAFSLIELDQPATAVWPFSVSEGAPTINYERSEGILVTQLYKDNTKAEWIDLKADLDGKVYNNVSGKFNNTASTDRCQINTSSTMYFPTTKDCDITLYGMNEIKTTIIAGKTSENGGYTAGKTVTATYAGAESVQTVNFKDDGRYYTKFEVTYKPQSATRPVLTSVKYGDTELSAAQLTSLLANKTIDISNVTPDVENDNMPLVTATTDNGEVIVSQATINSRSAVITLKTTNGTLVDTYNLNFGFSVPAASPTFIKYIINGVEYPEGVREITVDDAPVSGTITLRFDHTMSALKVVSPVYHTTYSAEQGRDLVFHYWNLPVNTTSDLQFPASIFSDIYGGVLEGSDVNIHLHVARTPIPVTHKTFDFIVGKDGDINDAVNTANATDGSERFYIFVPNGEHELTGNEPFICYPDNNGVPPADSLGVNRLDLIGKEINNHKTLISRANVSLIGQSTEGVTLFNRPLIEGISYTATIHTGKQARDFYAEDLQLVNRFPYWKSLNTQGGSGAGRAVVFQDQGNRSIMKNVELWSYQDTYYSSNANADYRGYFENCTLAGVVDFLCGNGDIWLEKCDIVLRDRSGNNIAAPSQEKTHQWGYVFNSCNIKSDVENPVNLKDRSWSLARPWAGNDNQSPAVTYLNTKMWYLPRDAGWEKMGAGALLRFHEYHSMDRQGNQISLGSRSLAACAPGAGSDDCILSADDAERYTIQNVLGGSDSFMPQVFTQQVDALSGGEKDANNSLSWNDNIEIDDDRLQWSTEQMALCYFVFKKDKTTGEWHYITNVAQATDDETVTGLSLEPYGNGIYCVRAANQRGGLGAPTREIEFVVSEKYILTIKKVETVDGVDYGWSTICLPYNSKVPTVNVNGEEAELQVFAANGVNSDDEDVFDVINSRVVSDYKLYLTDVDIVNKDQGYAVYGPVGEYQFASSSHQSDVVTILKGNPGDEAIPTGNNNCYVLANKTSYGIGFYKYTGSTLAAKRAWLPVEKVSATVQSNTSSGTRSIQLVRMRNNIATVVGTIPFGNDLDATIDPTTTAVYDLMGNRVSRPVSGRIYIVKGRKVKW